MNPFPTMNTRTHTTTSPSRDRSAFKAFNAMFRQPSYDCRELPDAVNIVVYVPGVGSSGVEIEAHGPDLIITAHKTRFVRVNWQALNLEGSQRDYRLRLRLGLGFDYSQMEAAITDGVLTLSVPKRLPELAASRLGCCA
jgi:HSP20 family protein